MCLSKAPRIRPGQTRELDEKAKQRTKLLKSRKAEDRRTARLLDKDIKRTFRQNIRCMKVKLADEMARSPPSAETQFLKRALALDGMKDKTTAQVDPGECMVFMDSIQPSRDRAPVV